MQHIDTKGGNALCTDTLNTANAVDTVPLNVTVKSLRRLLLWFRSYLRKNHTTKENLTSIAK